MYYFKDLSGQKFGKLLVISRCENKLLKCGRSLIQWNCVCDCDSTKIIKTTTALLRIGKTHCGCIKRIYHGHPTHGLTNTRLFTIWSGIIQRCNNPNHVGYSKYGGRGIKLCDEWFDKFEAFYEWANNNGYNEKLSLDRIDNDKGYYPENCRWSTPSEQQRNRRDNSILTYNGETKLLQDWCRIFGMSRRTIYWRIKHNYPIENLFDPPRDWEAEKKSGCVGVIWQKHSQQWVVKGYKNGKRDTYVAEFKNLKDAIMFKKQYDSENPYPTP